MGRNRTLGAPLQVTTKTGSFTTSFDVDVYPVFSPSAAVTVTLDPNAVDGDQVQISDVGGQAATHNITISPSAEQTIVGQVGSIEISTDYGTAVLMYSEAQAGWILQAAATGSATPGTPTASVPVGGGAGGTGTVASLFAGSNDLAGQLLVNTDQLSGAGPGILAIVTFGTPLAAPPKAILVTPALPGALGLGLSTYSAPELFDPPSNTAWSLSIQTNTPLQASSTYAFYYLVVP